MANGLMGAARGAGALGGIADIFGSQQGQKAIGKLFQSEEERLLGRVSAEGSFGQFEKDLTTLAEFSLPTAKLMVESDPFYNSNPAAKELLLRELGVMGGVGADTANLSEKELKEFRVSQATTILDRLLAMQRYGVPKGGPVRKELEAPLQAKYREEGFWPTERAQPTPTGYEAWTPETKGKYLTAAGMPSGFPMTGAEAATARIGGQPLRKPMLKPTGRVAGFLLEQDVAFKDLPAKDKPLIALLASGDEAMVRAMEMTGASYDELEKKFPILRDAPALKEHLGMEDWRKYDSVAIEGQSAEKRLATLAWLIKSSELDDKSLKWLVNNWLFANLAEPAWWKEATPRPAAAPTAPTGGMPTLGGGAPGIGGF